MREPGADLLRTLRLAVLGLPVRSDQAQKRAQAMSSSGAGVTCLEAYDTSSPIESERGKPSGAHVELQCCNVARISVARDAARPKNSHLVGPPRGAETRPNLRVPVFGANFGLFGPPTAQGVVFRCAAWRLGAICPAHAASCFWLRMVRHRAEALARAPDATARRWFPTGVPSEIKSRVLGTQSLDPMKAQFPSLAFSLSHVG